MKGKRRNNLKLISAVSVSIFSLAVLFMGTFAWFTAYRDQQLAVETPFEVEPASAKFSKLTIHTLSSTAGGNYKFNTIPAGTFNADGSYECNTPIDFGTYTPNSKIHPLLMLFEFTEQLSPDANNPTTITATTSETFIADGEVDGEGDPVIKLHENGNPLSSIVKFKSFSYPNNTAGSQGTSVITGISSHNGTTNTYDYAISSLSDSDSFVTITNNGKDLIYPSENGFDNSPKFFNATSGSVRYVAVVIDYYADAMDYIYNYYLGTEALEKEYIYFKCDWTLLIV